MLFRTRGDHLTVSLTSFSMKMVNLNENFQKKDELEGGANWYFQSANEVPDTGQLSWPHERSHHLWPDGHLNFTKEGTEGQLTCRGQKWQISNSDSKSLHSSLHYTACHFLRLTLNSPKQQFPLFTFKFDVLVTHLYCRLKCNWYNLLHASSSIHIQDLNNRHFICLSNFMCRKVY